MIFVHSATAYDAAPDSSNTNQVATGSLDWLRRIGALWILSVYEWESMNNRNSRCDLRVAVHNEQEEQ